MTVYPNDDVASRNNEVASLNLRRQISMRSDSGEKRLGAAAGRSAGCGAPGLLSRASPLPSHTYAESWAGYAFGFPSPGLRIEWTLSGGQMRFRQGPLDKLEKLLTILLLVLLLRLLLLLLLYPYTPPPRHHQPSSAYAAATA